MRKKNGMKKKCKGRGDARDLAGQDAWKIS